MNVLPGVFKYIKIIKHLWSGPIFRDGQITGKHCLFCLGLRPRNISFFACYPIDPLKWHRPYNFLNFLNLKTPGNHCICTAFLRENTRKTLYCYCFFCVKTRCDTLTKKTTFLQKICFLCESTTKINQNNPTYLPYLFWACYRKQTFL